MKQRIEVLIKGEVQKVGYRDIVQKFARTLDIKGFVQNLRDGNVFIVSEGEKENLEKFLKEIHVKKHFIDVEEVNVIKESDYKGEFEYFDIKYGALEEELGERMGVGIAYAGATWEETKATREDINAMHKDLKEGFKGMDEDLKEGFKGMHKDLKEGFKGMHEDLKVGFKATQDDLKEGFKGTRQDIQAMHGDMNKNFHELDEKYHTVSKNLESLNENLTKVVEGLTTLIKDHIEKDRK